MLQSSECTISCIKPIGIIEKHCSPIITSNSSELSVLSLLKSLSPEHQISCIKPILITEDLITEDLIIQCKFDDSPEISLFDNKFSENLNNLEVNIYSSPDITSCEEPLSLIQIHILLAELTNSRLECDNVNEVLQLNSDSSRIIYQEQAKHIHTDDNSPLDFDLSIIDEFDI